MKIEEIQAQCEMLSNEQLMLIVTNKIRYNEMIVRAAHQELRKRGITKDQMKEIKRKQDRAPKPIEGDIHEDLVLWEKIAFFYLFFPRLHFLVLRDYRSRKLVLKVKQAGYYMFAGMLLFMIGLIGSIFFYSISIGIVLWAMMFPAVHAFNRYYFKPLTIRRLAARISQIESSKEQ